MQTDLISLLQSPEKGDVLKIIQHSPIVAYWRNVHSDMIDKNFHSSQKRCHHCPLSFYQCLVPFFHELRDSCICSSYSPVMYNLELFTPFFLHTLLALWFFTWHSLHLKVHIHVPNLHSIVLVYLFNNWYIKQPEGSGCPCLTFYSMFTHSSPGECLQLCKLLIS